MTAAVATKTAQDVPTGSSNPMNEDNDHVLLHTAGNNSADSHQHHHPWQKLFQDAITIRIPLSVTVDLGVAMQRSRKKRIEAIYQEFPMLRKQQHDKDAADVLVQRLAEESARTSPTAASDADDNDDDGVPSDSKAAAGTAAAAKDNKQDHDAVAKKKPLKHVPQPGQFGSVIDYLEAKYVRGVVLADDDDGDAELKDGEEEEEGSVYSEDSFFDDTDLKRDVAEQVLAKTTHTKLELEQEDGDFFVNVGNLEVEDNEFNEYDPLDDEEEKAKKTGGSSNDAKGGAGKGTKKRKRNVNEGAGGKSKTTTSTAATAKTSKGAIAAAGGPTKKPKMAATEKSTKREDASQAKLKKKTAAHSGQAKEVQKPKKEKKIVAEPKKEPVKILPVEDVEDNSDDDNSDVDDDDDDNKEDVPRLDTKKTREDQENPELIARAQQAKIEKDAIMKEVINAIHEMTEQELPRKKKKKTKIRVSLTCPLGKKPGDTITFANPHIPGQRLKVQIPKDTAPGATFRVTVPVPEGSDEPEDDDDDEGDKNKFSRDMQEMLDNLCRIYDEWCDAQGLIQNDFAVHAEKRKKFELLAKEFPGNLVTPVDATYLKKVVRRARQNRQKRSKTAAARQQQQLLQGGSVSSIGADRDDMDEDGMDDSPMQQKQRASKASFSSPTASQEHDQDDAAEVSAKLILAVPTRGVVFEMPTIDIDVPITDK